MSLEDVASGFYRTEETRALDEEFGELLDLDRTVMLYLGKLEYENIGQALLMRARDFNFFVGVRKDFLERATIMTPTTYNSMLNYGYIVVAGNVNGIDIIGPTQKLLQQVGTKPKVQK